mmetsp:Transcript_47236/g.111385  ORF Transcript_47236/g.111385 Transcript_47236/m.111385 type:complete len:275 (+) Transcript_47236:140-964(+)|eukprot:CAMPEP_0117012668 /NCGR_PEP_ID=MMETSP0472-20121206/10613_1 /TAXON_ID=693140 ORGANISM="Tiarina fusus, Strain LIS" /NCGR_SAMPLE_ID=MMETSP0472 /ASSEMBLY_ACC=CAM_ASM_000603 /LENGTH=274 /DNA_ID=CAMNT_0004715797 /DNA_START=137 /DNA_END=961 /DNA_ORIENTATION=-
MEAHDPLLAHDFVPTAPQHSQGNFLKAYSKRIMPVFFCGALLFFGMGVLLAVVSIHSPPPPSTASCQAKLLIIRHAEKPEKAKDEVFGKPNGNLSSLGQARAHYLARCVKGKKTNSTALPWGEPTVLMAAADTDTSARARKTLAPVAKALGLKLMAEIDSMDYGGFVEHLDTHVGCGDTVLACWHHDEMPDLVKYLGAPNYPYGFVKWPKHCDSETFLDPPTLPGSKCYDMIWAMPLSKEFRNSSHWSVGWIAPQHQGFGGTADSPCMQDLEPL